MRNHLTLHFLFLFTSVCVLKINISADNKTNFVNNLKSKLDHNETSFSLEQVIKDQEQFTKVSREYVTKAWVVELVKVYNILGNEICAMAECGDIYKEISDSELQINPSRCSSPVIDIDQLNSPLNLKTN